MHITPRRISGTYEIALEPRIDHRGYFLRFYEKALFEQHDMQTDWVQENQSLSVRKNTVRGLHFQKPPHTETKLVRVIRGAILDVFVDLRSGSPTYGQWDCIELTEDNYKMIYIPKGFAHGFCTLTENTIVMYKVDAYYAPHAEGGLRWNDPTLAIEWPVRDETEEVSLSEKDQRQPFFDAFETPF